MLTPPAEVRHAGERLLEIARSLDARFAELETLSRLTERVGSALLLDEILDHVFESFRAIIPYNRIGFSLLEDEGRTVRAHWARSDASHPRIPKGFARPLAGSSLEGILEANQPRILNNLEEYLAAHPDSVSTRLIVEEGVRSSLTCPLVALGKPIGFLFFSSFAPDTYADVHVDVFVRIAGSIASILEKSRLYQRIAEANRAKDKLLAVVAHDLRNPIGVAAMYADLLADETFGTLTGEQREAADLIASACKRMASLVNDLLDVAAIESGHLRLQREPIDVAVFLRRIVGANRLIAREKQVEVDLSIEAPLPVTDLDPSRIDQVVNNLIGNAIKYSHCGTRVLVTARSTGASLEITVRDEGQGIPATELPKLFRDYGRTSVRPTAGERSTGLGLAISRRVVEAHGGRIGVESIVGRGSTFRVQLPLRTESSNVIPIAVAGATSPSADATSEALRARSVLVVEDDPPNARLLEQILRREGYQVQQASSIEEARAALEGPSPALVLMDIHVPGGGGEALLHELRRNPRFDGTSVVAVTASAMIGDRERFLRAGFDDYVSKPFELRAFLEQVPRWITAGTPQRLEPRRRSSVA